MSRSLKTPDCPPKLGGEFRAFRYSTSLSVLGFLLLLLTSCAQEMAEQPRYEPLEASSFFEDARSARPLPEGTVARGQLADDEAFSTGMQRGQLITTFPVPVTRELLDRGRERYNIFCTPCHDQLGSGKGLAALRGFERMPASLHEQRLKEAPHGYFYFVISNGFGVMNDYAAQIPPADRWAIVAYIRALQLSQDADLSDLSAADRQELERAAQ